MVHLVLSATRGNSGGRYFPHQGYLGLTPVRVEGTVRTRLDQDGRPIPAKSLSISIRCYQSRLTRTRAIRSTLVVDHTDVLWVKPPTRDFADVGELELPFKLTIPKRTPGFSTANYQDYRVFWRLEAILDHVPIPGVGSRIVRYYDLALTRYDIPPSINPAPSPGLPHQTSKPRAPAVRYNVSTSSVPVGPSDIVYATLVLQPLDPGVSIRSAVVSIERRIDLHNTPAAPTPLVTAGINYSVAASASPITTFSPASPVASTSFEEDAPTPTTSRFQGQLGTPHSPYSLNGSQATLNTVASDFSHSSSAPLLSPSGSSGASSPIPIPRAPSPAKPLPSPSSSLSVSPLVSSSLPPEPPMKTLLSTIVSTEVGSFSGDSSGQWVKNVTLQWPEARGNYRWAIGETTQSEFASVRFFLRTKLSVSGPGGSDTLELEPRELTVVPTNDVDRRVAMEKWAEQKEQAQRSKSKSPWRRRTEDGPSADGVPAGHGLPSPPQTPAHSSSSTGTRRTADGKARKKVPRRPHTSAGPSDKSNVTFAAAAAAGSMRSEPDRVDHTSSQDSTRSSSSHGRPSMSRKLRESGLGESMLYAVDKVRGKSRAEGDGKRERERDGEEGEEERLRRERLKTTGLGLQLGLEVDAVRAWEEELARIEVQSRRSSVSMLGMLGPSLRKRSGG